MSLDGFIVDFKEPAFEASANDSSSSDDDSCSRAGYLTFVFLNMWSAVANLFVVVVLFRTPSIRRTFGGVMLSLATADFCVSVFVIPMAIIYFYNCSRWEFGFTLCGIWITINSMLTSASVVHHCSVAIARFLAIARPHQHNWLKVAANSGLFYRVIFPSWSMAFAVGIAIGSYTFAYPESVSDLQEPYMTCQIRDRMLAIVLSALFLLALLVIFIASFASIYLLRKRVEQRISTAAANKINGPDSSNETGGGGDVAYTAGNGLNSQSAPAPPTLVLTPPDGNANNSNNNNNSIQSSSDLMRRWQLLRKAHIGCKPKPVTSNKLTLPQLVRYYLEEGDYFGNNTPPSWSPRSTFKSSISVTSVTDGDENSLDATSGSFIPGITLSNSGVVRLVVPPRYIQAPRTDCSQAMMEAIREDDEPTAMTPCYLSRVPSVDSFTSIMMHDFDCDFRYDLLRNDMIELVEDSDENAFICSTREMIEANSEHRIMPNGATARSRKPTSTSSYRPPPRKRAFSVDLPLSYLYFQQAPLAQFETRSKKNSVSSVGTPSSNMSQCHSNSNSNSITNSHISGNMTHTSGRRYQHARNSVSSGSRSRINTQPQSALNKTRNKNISHKRRVVSECERPGDVGEDEDSVMRERARKKRAASIPVEDELSFAGKPHRGSIVRTAIGGNLSAVAEPGEDDETELASVSETTKTAAMAASSSTIKLDDDDLTTQPSFEPAARKSLPVIESKSQPTSPACVSRSASLRCPTARQQRLARTLQISPASSSSVGESAAEIGVERGEFGETSRFTLFQRAASIVSSMSTDSLKHIRCSFQQRRINDSFKARKKTSLALERFRRRERQTERALFFILFFMLLWVPFFTVLFLRGICPQLVRRGISDAFTWCGYASAALNPLVYALFNDQFLDSAKGFIRRCCRFKKAARSGRKLSARSLQRRASHFVPAESTFASDTMPRNGLSPGTLRQLIAIAKN